MKVWFSLPLLTLVLLASLQPAVAQEETPVVLRLAGREGPPTCDVTDLRLLCFETLEGDPATAFVAGETVRVELSAAGAPHNLAVILDGDQGDLGGINTDGADAIAMSDTADGSTVFLEFTVPASGTLYFWCDVGEHEAVGMKFTSDIQPAPDAPDNETSGNTTDGNATDGNTTDGSGGPGTDGNATADDNATDGNDTMAAPQGGDLPTDEEESPAAPVLLVPTLGAGYLAYRRRRA